MEVTEQNSPDDYFYQGISTFTMNPFTNLNCTITYSCTMISGPANLDLCNYQSGSTTTTFDPTSGDYTFTSEDYSTFKTQTLSFMITGTAGVLPTATSGSITFDLNLFATACSSSPTLISIDSTIIEDSIEYFVYDQSKPISYILDKTNVKYDPPTSDSCSIELSIVNSDDSLLD